MTSDSNNTPAQSPKCVYHFEYDPATRQTSCQMTPGFPLDVLTNYLMVSVFMALNNQIALMMNHAQQQGQKAIVDGLGQPLRH